MLQALSLLDLGLCISQSGRLCNQADRHRKSHFLLVLPLISSSEKAESIFTHLKQCVASWDEKTDVTCLAHGKDTIKVIAFHCLPQNPGTGGCYTSSKWQGRTFPQFLSGTGQGPTITDFVDSVGGEGPGDAVSRRKEWVASHNLQRLCQHFLVISGPNPHHVLPTPCVC